LVCGSKTARVRAEHKRIRSARLDLVPDLRQLLVAAQLGLGDRRYHLFRTRAPGKRQPDFLPSDGIHFRAHNVLNFEQGPLCQRQVREISV
jgi:hypothetical protein